MTNPTIPAKPRRQKQPAGPVIGSIALPPAAQRVMADVFSGKITFDEGAAELRAINDFMREREHQDRAALIARDVTPKRELAPTMIAPSLTTDDLAGRQITRAKSTKVARSRMDDRPYLTDEIVRALDRTGKPAIVYDGNQEGQGHAGFGIRRRDRMWVLNYYTRTGVERRYPIGQFPTWKAERARKRVMELQIAIDKGGDPMGDEHASRDAPTVEELIKRFDEDHISKKRASTAVQYRHALSKHIQPAIGRMKVDDVKFEDADRLHRKISRDHPYAANRVIAIGHRMFLTAIRLNMRTDAKNPFANVALNPEEIRHKHLTRDELVRLLQAMAQHPDPRSVRPIRLMLLTGARRGEVLAASWNDIEITQDANGKLSGTWTKPAHSVKQGQTHSAPLNGPACQLLNEIRAEQTAGRKALPSFVFPGHGKRGHIYDIARVWRRLCRDAEIENMRMHDLRHSHATFLASGGSSLLVIGQLIGHRTAAATKRYAHLLNDPLVEATERVGEMIEAAGNPDRPAAGLEQLPRRRK
jgi:integrase